MENIEKKKHKIVDCKAAMTFNQIDGDYYYQVEEESFNLIIQVKPDNEFCIFETESETWEDFFDSWGLIQQGDTVEFIEEGYSITIGKNKKLALDN